MSLTSLAFSNLNLRRNPFGEMTRDERAAVAIVDLGDLAFQIRQPGHAVQFLAPHGRGKTTNLIALHRHVPSWQFLRIFEDSSPHFEGERGRLIDSFDKLPRRLRKSAYSTSTSLGITTHIDLAREIRRAGYQVTTRVVRTVDAGKLSAIFQRRIEFVRRGPGPVPRLDASRIAGLIETHGSDVRAMETELYGLFESWRKR